MHRVVVAFIILCATVVVTANSAPPDTAVLRKRLVATQSELTRAQALARSLHAKLERERAQHANDDDGDDEEQEKLREMRRAFSRLLAEKKELTRVVRDEQTQLQALQEKIQNPTLGAWLRKRTSSARAMLDLPESEALAYYAKLYVRPKIGRARQRLAALEKRVERGVDVVLPARVGSAIAVLLTAALVGFPALLVTRLAVSLSRTLSLAQYVLLVNVFLSALAAGLLVARLILGQDPLQTLYESAEHLFVATQLVLGIAFPGFLALLGATVWRARKRGNAYIFGCELLFYTFIGLNYRRRVWQPVMVGEVLHANTMMYLVYLADFVCMTVLTISAAKVDGDVTPTFARGTAPSYLPMWKASGKHDEGQQDGKRSV